MSIDNAVEFFHEYIYGKLLDENACAAVGAIKIVIMRCFLSEHLKFCIIANLVLILQIALNLFLRVRLNKHVDNGRYDWKLYTPVILAPTIFVGIFLGIGSFGPDNYSCFVRPDRPFAAVFSAVMCLVSIIAATILFLSVLFYTRKTLRETSLNTISGGSTTVTPLERKIIRKLLMYVLACLLQYIPGCIYPISFLFTQNRPVAIFVIAIIAIHTGGILNAIILIFNEGFVVKKTSNPSADTNNRPVNQFTNFKTYEVSSNYGGKSSSLRSDTYGMSGFSGSQFDR
ncbi:hypothetical protein HK096_009007 [Nowakowskiella sp. JEL0078]|nr:hypothetical protein HK096_009007 [Nowakowskiella sp. JEL0078]